MPRFYCPAPLATGQSLELPAGRRAPCAGAAAAARRRPSRCSMARAASSRPWSNTWGAATCGCRWARTCRWSARPRAQVHLAVGMPANERMDWLVEKATELGAASIQPLVAERSVLKLDWRTRAEEAGALAGHRDRRLRAMRPQPGSGDPRGAWTWRAGWPCLRAQELRLVLSLSPAARPLAQAAAGAAPLLVLSGPEGGLTAHEEQAALAQGFQPAQPGRARAARGDRAARRAGGTYTGTDEPQPVAAGDLPGPVPHQQRHLHRHQRPGRAGAGTAGMDGDAAGDGLRDRRRTEHRHGRANAGALRPQGLVPAGLGGRAPLRLAVCVRGRRQAISGFFVSPPWWPATTTPTPACTVLRPPS